MQDIRAYLEASMFDIKLSSNHRDLLEAPITETKVLITIQCTKSNKPPGRDGLPAEFYKRFKHLLAEPITNLCNALLNQGVMPPSWKEGCIVVLPKKDKDPTNVASYRPISLLNHYVKIFTTIMAKRLNMFVADYVHVNQFGFIPSKHISDNIHTMIHYCKLKKTKALVAALDAEKPFDRLEVVYLQALLKHEFWPGVHKCD